MEWIICSIIFGITDRSIKNLKMHAIKMCTRNKNLGHCNSMMDRKFKFPVRKKGVEENIGVS